MVGEIRRLHSKPGLAGHFGRITSYAEVILITPGPHHYFRMPDHSGFDDLGQCSDFNQAV